jgi:long-chain acyl-CoA synthetase
MPERSGSPLLEALARQVRDLRDREALRSEGEGLSVRFGTLGERVAAWAAALRKARLEEGELVALAVGNVAAFPELFFALRQAGAAALAVDDGATPAGFSEVCRAMGAAASLHRRPDWGGEPLEGAPDPSVRLARTRAGRRPPAATGLVKLTSGSTLNPRGACFTDGALAEGIAHIAEAMSLTRADRVLVSIPLSHSYGFDNGVLSLAWAGTPLVLQPDVLPAALLRTIREREVTFFPAVPALVRALARAAWPAGLRLRGVISASAPLSPEAARAFHEASGVPVAQFFGATECGGISFETRPEDPEAQGTVGFPLPGVRIEIHPEEGVRVHSAANRSALLPEAPDVPPWVATGDRAERTPGGRLRLLGRIRPLGNVGGVKVDLGAIDAFLRGLPGVEDAVTMALEDPARGHRLVSCVETRAHTPESLLELCRERLSAREIPAEIRVMSLPRTPRGKLDRSAVAGLLGEVRPRV